MEANDVAIVIATADDKPIFRNLMNLYKYDLSEYSKEDPNSHGTFEYNYLDHYWSYAVQTESRVPFLVRVNGQLAGFILKYGKNAWSALRRPDVDHVLSEFFIMRKWRRQGIGRRVAFELFRRYPGVWEVSQERANAPAQRFWAAVIGEYTQGHFEHIESYPPDWDGPVQVFRSE